MEIINGDITSIKKGVIIHQVNNKKVMGAGVAKAIRNKYPEHYEDYKSSNLAMGSLVVTMTSSVAIIGFVSQNGYGNRFTSKGKIFTDYVAFEACCKKIAKVKKELPNVDFYMPYLIGCGFGGGDWKVISEIIERVCPFIILVKL